jgi:hypothetical protein
VTTTTGKGAAVATAAKGKTYSGTLYIAGNGGHFAVAQVEIDPSAEYPIKLTKDLDRIVLGSKDSYPVHDPRIDDNDRTKMYWATYKADKQIAGGMTAHMGYIDLKKNEVAKDVQIKIDDRATWTGAVYCASGQTKANYLPVTMTGEAYIDVIKKDDMSHVKRIFLDKEGFKDNYWFYHGTNSPDYKTFVVAVNGTEKWQDAKTPGKPNGKVDMLLLDMASLEKGQVKVLAKNTVMGEGGKTLTFRQYFTPDGKMVLQSAADRFMIFDAKTMKLVKEELNLGGENHDAMPTPDGKYAILTLRANAASEADPEAKKTLKDGTLLLYDLTAKKVVGKSTSVCYGCHKQLGLHADAPLCGIDGNLK